MLTDPIVSVIVPNYNHARFLPKRLDSIFNQTYQDFEVILLDDCSTDSSVEMLRSYAGHPRVSHLGVNDQNSGSPFKQWKKGIALARGRYIWIAESDDWAEADFLEKLMPHFTDTTGLVYCRSEVIDENDEAFMGDFYWPNLFDGRKWHSDYENDGLQEIAQCLVYRNTIPTASACIINKRLLGVFPAIDDFKYAGDWLFWVELLKDCRMYYCASSMNRHRLHGATTRGRATWKNEAVRLREYCRVIGRAREVACIRGDTRVGNYHWIFKEIYWHRGRFSVTFWWPPLPVWLRLGYLRFIAGKLGRRMFKKLRSTLRLGGTLKSKK